MNWVTMDLILIVKIWSYSLNYNDDDNLNYCGSGGWKSISLNVAMEKIAIGVKMKLKNSKVRRASPILKEKCNVCVTPKQT